ncbi:SGNH hydrolase-type esterase domain containing protein [Parasponia andersonii]|uniref:SGNH hydrolase-type esterase domain containing protein n=1 Tax=Parasponia andersonii TaxID=3476 RepID=A0A2P5B8I9_PARAD|nr:SGNH hydrolase-type esterase domain containing protein [Parasponia andersonii]
MQPQACSFDDSLFDAGNNNYIKTTAQANYYPYGETFF